MTLNTNSPLLFYFFAFTIGIVWQYYAFHLFFPTIIFAGSLLIIIWTQNNYTYQYLIYCVTLGLFFLLGSWRQAEQEYVLSKFEFFAKNGLSNIIGVVDDIEYYEGKKYKQTIILSPKLIHGEELPRIFKGKKIKIVAQNLAGIDIGNSIYFEKLILQTSISKQQKQLLMRAGFLGTSYLNATHSYILCSQEAYSFQHWLKCKKYTLRENLKKRMSSLTFSLFDTLFLGFRSSSREYQTIKQNFQLWGIVHYLARSGLHLVIISTLWKALLCCVPLGFIINNLLILFCIIFYALLTQFNISFIRALLLFILYTFCMLTNIVPHKIHLVLLTGFIILIGSPIELFFLDFQLSFSLTFFIALFAHYMGTRTPKKQF